MKQLIVIFDKYSEKKYELKVVTIQDKEIKEIFIERENSQNIVGNIYKGKIKDIIQNMDCVFVDIGQEKNSFLYIKNKNFLKTLKKNDDLMVQVESLARDEKGAKLTLDYSIQGKYLVLLPNSQNRKILISNKIKNSEARESLENVFKNKLEKNTSLIIRTIAEDTESELLEKEYSSLLFEYENIKTKYKKAKVGELVYSENDFLKMILNEIENVDEIIVNDENILEALRERRSGQAKEKQLENKIRKYTKDENILKYFKIDETIEKALKKKVWLDCGGYIIIEKTEALISIDVNTGQNLGNKNFEQTILETNIEAGKEIAKQLRLRNLAGIIIIDFIDMKASKNKEKLLEIFKEELKKDSAKTNIVNFSNLGLVEMTRKRNGEELASFYKEKCKFCEGNGDFISEDRIILNILSEIKMLSLDEDINIVEIVSEEKIIKKLKKDFVEYLEIILNKQRGDCVSLSPTLVGAKPPTPQKEKSDYNFLRYKKRGEAISLSSPNTDNEFLRRSLKVQLPTQHISEQRSGRAKSQEDLFLKDKFNSDRKIKFKIENRFFKEGFEINLYK